MDGREKPPYQVKQHHGPPPWQIGFAEDIEREYAALESGYPYVWDTLPEAAEGVKCFP